MFQTGSVFDSFIICSTFTSPMSFLQMFRNYLNNLKIHYSVWVVKHDFTSKNSLIKASPQRQCFVNITNYLKAPEPRYEIDNVFKYIITVHVFTALTSSCSTAKCPYKSNLLPIIFFSCYHTPIFFNHRYHLHLSCRIHLTYLIL